MALDKNENTIPRKPVICVETGEIWDSEYYAAKALKCSPVNISNTLTGKQETCRGYHLRFLNPDSKKGLIYLQSVEEINQVIIDSNVPTFHKSEVNKMSLPLAYVAKKMNLYDISEDIFYLWAGGNKRGCIYAFDLSGRANVNKMTDGLTVFRAMTANYKVPDLRQDAIITHRLLFVDNKFVMGINPILGFNPKLTNQEHDSYEYDINSAYAAALVQPIPDTSYIAKRWGKVGPGQIGFSIAADFQLQVDTEGEFSEFIYNLMPSPFTEFVDYWYNIKANPENDEEKALAKNYLTFGIGYLQKINPFIRATVMWRCNSLIKSLIDENTILWNTDAIYSLTPKPELTIGTGLGEWKLIHQKIKYKSLEYQIEGEKPHYRGIPRALFGDDFDLLTDELPERGNIYYYNKEANRIDYIRKCSVQPKIGSTERLS